MGGARPVSVPRGPPFEIQPVNKMPVRKRQTEKLTWAAPRFYPHLPPSQRPRPSLAGSRQAQKARILPIFAVFVGPVNRVNSFPNDYLPSSGTATLGNRLWRASLRDPK